MEIKVGEIRPYIYALWEKTKGIHETYENYTKIQIYDINTLELVGEITDGGNDLDVMAISKDGKYLAAMNIGTSYLIVWDLDTRSKVIEKQIGIWKGGNDISEPADIKFSELNTDKIYFTGKFYQPGNAETLEGLCIFSISENRIIDSTFALPPNRIAANTKVTLFANETKYIGPGYGYLQVIDLSNKTIEFSKKYTELDYLGSGELIYNENMKFFIGVSHLIDKFQYQPNTGVTDNNSREVIYPHPTNGIVNIPIHCNNSNKYEIYNTSGKLLQSTDILGLSKNLLTIDFTDYTKGHYFVNVYCGKDILKFQVVKGE